MGDTRANNSFILAAPSDSTRILHEFIDVAYKYPKCGISRVTIDGPPLQKVFDGSAV
jgi:hypothetical protein